MDNEQRILEELVKAKENIKRKFIALKSGEANISAEVIKTLDPVIEHLNIIHKEQTLSSLKHSDYNQAAPEDYIKEEEEKLVQNVTVLTLKNPNILN
ncbi:Hypothetical protein CINCED_3A013965 [Cinara cedri]|uniref:Uncharacterized protein n=1 Tax=Cinara cedri TaxID=506608 RepID=A0A5E4NQL6_9HEMI|nr:Hypothetical protein CINCED_3A013965 [Cinara cedri]